MKKLLSVFLALLLFTAAASAAFEANTDNASKEVFSSEERLKFCLYLTVAEACHSMYAVQGENPEISFSVNDQKLELARFYLTYYGVGDKEAIAKTVEEYTDTLIDTICAAYPHLDIEILNFCWKITDIDPDSLYTATYWCENDGSVIVRGEGDGKLYQ